MRFGDGALYMRPNNWGEFQHYHDGRDVIWIKNYLDLDDPGKKFSQLSFSDQGRLQKLWRLASRLNLNGRIPFDETYLRKHLGDKRFALASHLVRDWFAVGSQMELETLANREFSSRPLVQNSTPKKLEVRSKEKPLPDKPARKRDELWDSLVLELGYSPATSSERGRWNASLKQLRQVEATPVELRSRCSVYRKRWPEVSLTPSALAANWESLAPLNGHRQSSPPCEECGIGSGLHLADCSRARVSA
jgi:hypothetical protein